MPYSTSLSSSLLFLAVFILAFFPGAFISILKLPLTLYPTTTTPSAALVACSCSYPPPQPPLPSTSLPPTMSFFQRTFTLPSRSRGSYLITSDVIKALPEIKDFKVGILHLFIQHTSCALSLNENYDADVRADMSDALDRIVPEDSNGKGVYRHDAEGADDMPVSGIDPLGIQSPKPPGPRFARLGRSGS
jgi:hypothetical protein